MIEAQIKTYIENLNIGNDVTITGVLASFLSLVGNLSAPAFSIQSISIGKSEESLGNADIAIAFKEVASIGAITITEV